jgi:hypothetical protein
MTVQTPLFSKEELIDKIKEIAGAGWIEMPRRSHHGGIGNTIEDILGIEENNLPIPNAAEWEIKTHRTPTNSLLTLGHIEPSPRAAKIVPQILLPKYGWRHAKAGILYPDTELSFRQTLSTKPTDRGFFIVVNDEMQRIEIHFDGDLVSPSKASWLETVKTRIGMQSLDPIPYWGFDDLFHKLGVKLLNTFLVEVETRNAKGIKQFKCRSLKILRGFTKEGMLESIRKNFVLIDFDARTGHNHGTKIRIRRKCLAEFYSSVTDVTLFD